MKAIRAAFFLLLAGNLLLFAYARGLFGPAGGGEADRLESQLVPEKLHIVGKGESTGAEPRSEACHAVAGLTPELTQKLAEFLRRRDPGLNFAQRAEVPGIWWVYVPPQPNRAQAERKAAEMKQVGIGDFFVVQEAGANQFAISLGLFKSEQGAKDRLDALQKKGVRSARLEMRQAGEKAALEVRGPVDRVAKAMASLPAEFAAASVAECAAPAKP